MAETLDELGPVDWLVVEFPGPDFGKGQIAPFLEDLVNRDLIRVLDMVFLLVFDNVLVHSYSDVPSGACHMAQYLVSGL